MGNRFRMVVNEVDVIQPEKPLTKLPVASAVWIPRPNLKVAATGWILAGGAHHTGFSQSVTTQHLEDFAEIANLEFLVIDNNTNLAKLKNELKWNDMYYLLARGF
jgi:L-arabinose isomerase